MSRVRVCERPNKWASRQEEMSTVGRAKKYMTYEILWTTLVIDSNVRPRVLLDDLEWPMLHVLLNLRVVDFSSDQPLRVEHGILGVGGEGVFRGVSDSANAVSDKKLDARRE